LTPEQMRKFLDGFEEAFQKKYRQALSSGAIDEEFSEEGDHTIARCVLQIAADNFYPMNPKGRKLLKNLECFI